jgi:hypothetical protein
MQAKATTDVKVTKAQQKMLRDALNQGGRMGVGFNTGRVRCAHLLAEKGLATVDFYGATRITLTEAGRVQARKALVA